MQQQFKALKAQSRRKSLSLASRRWNGIDWQTACRGSIIISRPCLRVFTMSVLVHHVSTLNLGCLTTILAIIQSVDKVAMSNNELLSEEFIEQGRSLERYLTMHHTIVRFFSVFIRPSRHCSCCAISLRRRDTFFQFWPKRCPSLGWEHMDLESTSKVIKAYMTVSRHLFN